MRGKLTGAGGGGFAIALVPPSMSQPALAAAKLELQAKGYTCSEERVRSLLSTSITIINSGADPGSGAFLTPGSGMGKKPRSGINIPNHISKSLETIFWVKIFKFLYAEADPGTFWPWIRDGKIRIRDKNPASTTLIIKELSHPSAMLYDPRFTSAQYCTSINKLS
jgi:hypothetical protein